MGVAARGPGSATYRGQDIAPASRLSFYAQQAMLLGGVVVSIVIAALASDVLRGYLLPIIVPGRPFLNPVILAVVIFYAILGLFTVFRRSDRGWPVFASFVGLAVFLVAAEDMIHQFFIFQGAIQTVGGRVNPVAITASVAAFAFTVLLHQNQVAQRLRALFEDRGIDAREIRPVTMHMRALAHRVAWPLVAAAGGASVVLFVVGAVVRNTGVGLGGLGILGGLVFVLAIGTMVYRLLSAGPQAADGETGPSVFRPGEGPGAREQRRRPPRGLKGR